MECKILLTISNCSCYVRKSQEADFQLHHIEGEEYFDFGGYNELKWNNFAEYLTKSLAINNKKEEECNKKKFIPEFLNCDIIYSKTDKKIIDIIKKSFTDNLLLDKNYKPLTFKEYFKNNKNLIQIDSVKSITELALILNSNEIKHFSKIKKQNSKKTKDSSSASSSQSSNTKTKQNSNSSEKWNSYLISRINNSNKFKYQGKKYIGYVHKINRAIIIRDNSNNIEILLNTPLAKNRFKYNEKVNINISSQGHATITKI